IGTLCHSNHHPVQIKSPFYKPKERQWKLNENMLIGAEDVESTKQELSRYFESNSNNDTPPTDNLVQERSKVLQQKRRQHHVHKIQFHTQEVTRNPDKVHKAFQNYYADLYNLAQSKQDGNSPIHRSRIEKYLDQNVPSKLSPQQAEELEQPLTLEELASALKLSKTPAPDGLPLTYLGTFREILLPELLDGLNYQG
ncbi:Hypothetical predicted protein, partial [Pelobates cultripes]